MKNFKISKLSSLLFIRNKENTRYKTELKTCFGDVLIVKPYIKENGLRYISCYIKKNKEKEKNPPLLIFCKRLSLLL